MGTLVAVVSLGCAWFILAGAVEPAEFFAGAIAIVVALAAVRGTDADQRMEQIFALRPARFAAKALRAIGQAFGDARLVVPCVFRAAVGGPRAAGSLGEQPIPNDGISTTGPARRAAAVTFSSYAPNSAVVSADAGRRRLTVHTLVNPDA